MKQENWNRNANKVRTWAKAQDEKNPQVKAIMITVSLGDTATDDESRSTYWTAVRSIGKSMPDFPKSEKGQGSNLTQPQQQIQETALATVANAFASIPTECHAMLLSVFHPHGKTGGLYADWNTLTDSFIGRAKKTMADARKDKRWDGLKMNKAGGLAIKGVVPKPKTTTDSEEVQSGE